MPRTTTLQLMRELHSSVAELSAVRVRILTAVELLESSIKEWGGITDANFDEVDDNLYKIEQLRPELDDELYVLDQLMPVLRAKLIER